MRNLKPNAILALEDVDCLFGSRTPIAPKLKEVDDNTPSEPVKKDITLSALLNCIDGSLSKENVIIILTTNHPEKLDPALIRVGRVDKKYKISNPDKELIEQYLEIFYGSPVQLDFEVIKNHRLSMSAVQDICIINKTDKAKALRMLQRGMYGMLEDIEK